MLMSVLMMLQTVPVGEPIKTDIDVQVTSAQQVGEKLTVSYRVRNTTAEARPVPKPSVVDPSGRKLPQGKPEDARIVAKPATDVLPGDSLDLTVTFDNVATAINSADPKTLNESTWFFIVGGARVPFRF